MSSNLSSQANKLKTDTVVLYHIYLNDQRLHHMQLFYHYIRKLKLAHFTIISCKLLVFQDHKFLIFRLYW